MRISTIPELLRHGGFRSSFTRFATVYTAGAGRGGRFRILRSLDVGGWDRNR